MNQKELKELIELVSQKGFAEFEVERQGFRLRIISYREMPAPATIAAPPAGPAPAAAPASADSSAGAAPAASSPVAAAAATAAALHQIKAPMPGTFYRAPAPGSEPFVNTGDRVTPETVVCIIEAMKLMNDIQAEISGEVAEIYVENGQPVEYGQALFGIKT